MPSIKFLILFSLLTYLGTVGESRSMPTKATHVMKVTHNNNRLATLVFLVKLVLHETLFHETRFP